MMRPRGASHPVWLYRRPTDMRKSFAGLSALVKHTLGEDPLSGGVYVFINRRLTYMKCIYFDVDGYCIWSKRLERGQFQMPFADDDKLLIDAKTLQLVIDGIDLNSVRQLTRYRRVRGKLSHHETRRNNDI